MANLKKRFKKFIKALSGDTIFNLNKYFNTDSLYVDPAAICSVKVFGAGKQPLTIEEKTLTVYINIVEKLDTIIEKLNAPAIPVVLDTQVKETKN